MKRLLFTLSLIAFSTGLFNCSGDNEYETEYYTGVDPQFNESDQELGSVMRESLRETTLQAMSEGVDFKDRAALQSISARVSFEVLSNRYPERKKEINLARQEYMRSQERLSTNGRTVDTAPQTLEEVLNSDAVELTTMQRRALEVIEYARNTSSSATVFMDKLAAINRRVDDLVPEGEREMLHQYISVTYHSLQEINHLVAEEHLPGRAEKRPKIESNIRVAQGSGLRLSDLMQTAHAQTEVTVLPVVVIVGSSNSGGSGSSGGVSYADWYYLQDAYGNGYSNGYNNGYQSGYQNGSSTSNQEEESWWNSWGKCAASVIAGAGGGAIAGGATGAGHAAVVVAVSGGTTAAPASVYVAGWAIFGAVTGGVGGAAAGC